jgi:hypothetical protein
MSGKHDAMMEAAAFAAGAPKCPQPTPANAKDQVEATTCRR